MTTKKTVAVTVKVESAVSDGKGGFLAKGAKVEAAEDMKSLKDKGLVG